MSNKAIYTEMKGQSSITLTVKTVNQVHTFCAPAQWYNRDFIIESLRRQAVEKLDSIELINGFSVIPIYWYEKPESLIEDLSYILT